MKIAGRVLAILILCVSMRVNAQNTMAVAADESIYRSAMDCMDKEQYAAARNQFEDFIQLNKKDVLTADAVYYRAYCALQLQNGDAEALYQYYLDNYQEHMYRDKAYLDLGNNSYNKKQYDKTIEYLSLVDPANLSEQQKTDYYFQYGYASFTKKEFDVALENFNKVKTKKNRYQYAACYYAAYIEFKNEDYEQSLQDLAQAENDEVYKNLAAVLKANIYYRKGDYAALITYAESLLQSNPNHKDVTEVYLLTADAYFNMKNFAKAGEYFGKAISNDASKSIPEIQYRIAFCHYMNAKYQEAAGLFKNLASSKDSIGQASSYYLGLSYIRLNNKQYALLPLDNARKTGTNKGIQEEAWFQYSKLNYELAKYTEATHALKQFIKFYPKSAHSEEASEMMSECYLAGSDYDEALSYIEGLNYANNARINAAYQKLAYFKASQLYNNGHYEDALKVYDKSLKYSFDKEYMLGAYYWKGEIYSTMQEWDRAINMYAQVFQKDPGARSKYYLKSRYGAGYAYYNGKDYNKALVHFKEYTKALEDETSKPFYEDALIRLADCYYVNKKWQDALDNYNLALERNSKDADYIWFQKAVVYTRKNQKAEAREAYTHLINSYPQSTLMINALYFRARIDLELGDDQKAYEGFSQVLAKSPEANPYLPHTYLNRAMALNNLGRKEEAIGDYLHIINNYRSLPISEEAVKSMQPIMAELDRTDEFNEILSKYKEGGSSSSTGGLAIIEYNNAQDLYSLGKYDKAAVAYDNFIKQYPEHEKAAEARYFQAESYYKLKDWNKALPVYDQILSDKTSIYFNRCMLKSGDVNMELKNYRVAGYKFKTLYEVGSSKKEKVFALQRLLDCHELQQNYDSVKYFGLEMLNTSGISSEQEIKTNLYVARACMNKKEYDLATDYCLEVINSAKDVHAAEALYMVGEIEYQQGLYKKSIETLRGLNDKYPDYELWVSKSYYLIAENWVGLKEYFQAKSTFKSIIDNSSELDIVEKSKARLVEVEAMEKGEVK